MKRANTSASNLYQRALCPGSGRMEAGLAEPPAETEWSTEGTMLHDLFMTDKDRSHLTPDQKETVELADRLTRDFLEAFRVQMAIPEDAPFYDVKEIPMAFIDASGAALFPGHADFIRTWPEQAIRAVVDAKFGYMEVEEAAENLQLATYAVMSDHPEKAKSVGVALVQPRNFGPRITTAVYSADYLPKVRDEIERVFLASEKPGAPLVSGERQCHFCKAKTVCEAYKAKFMQIEATLPQAIETVDNDRLWELQSAIKFAKKIESQVTDELRRRIEDGSIKDGKLRNTGDVREVTDPIGMFKAFMAYFSGSLDFTAGRYDACRSMTWSKLTELVQEVLGLSEKKAKETVDSISEPFVTRTPKAKSPVREKATKQLK